MAGRRIPEQAFRLAAHMFRDLHVAGVGLLTLEHHSHGHAHEVVEHEHAHRHDDGHHAHAHPGLAGSAWHTHRHRHDPLDHVHPHWPDLHHRHGHGADG